MAVDRETPQAPVLTGRQFCAVCAALLIAITTSSSGQTPAVDTSPVAAAGRAFNAGQYDQVEDLLQSVNGEASAVLRARAHVARGRYGEAEKLLAGVAGTTPAGDAALELGLLQLYLGRRPQGVRTLEVVLTRSQDDTPADLIRLGRAARALGRFPLQRMTPPTARSRDMAMSQISSHREGRSGSAGPP